MVSEASYACPSLPFPRRMKNALGSIFGFCRKMKEEVSGTIKLLYIPLEDSSISPYVPLSFFYGRGDGAVNLLFQRNEGEIIQIIPGGVETVSGTVVSSFSFSENSFAIAMESSKFKATHLAAQTYIILEKHNQTREREEEEHKKKRWDSSRLSFADDFD